LRFFTKFLLTLIIVLASAVSVFAAETRTVPANRTSAIFFYYTSTNDTCYSGGKPKVHITRKPEHGSITTMWKPFRMGKEAGKCAGKPMRGTLVIYKPAPGYRGPDKVSIIFSGGISTGYFIQDKEWKINITVK
jgi:hypothetical protein